MPESYDVIVIGLGAMGSATCYHLAGRGVRVLGLEQFDVPHPLGSSAGDTRIVRQAYFEHPDYVPLLRRAYQNWDELAERTGVQVLYRTGLVSFGASDSQVLDGTRQSAAQYGVDVEDLSLDEARHRFPMFQVPDGSEALYEPNAGFVLSERSITLFVTEALRRGVTVRARESVEALHSRSGAVEVVTNRGRYIGGQVVVTAGAWTGTLLREAGLPLRVARQVLGWVQPRTPDAFALGACPCWIIDDPDDGIYYGFPQLPAGAMGVTPGLKLGRHVPGPTADPGTLDRTVSPQDEERFRPALRRYLPDADGPTLAASVCMYTMTPDEHFILDRLPDREHILVAAGFSGHGFKFASALGEALADCATEGTTNLPIGFLGIDRLTPSV